MSHGIVGYRCHAVHLEQWNMDVTIILTEDRQVYIPIRQMCGGLGISSTSQLETLRAHEPYASALLDLTIPTAGGAQEVACLPKLECARWLANIDPKRVKAQVRDHLEEIQADIWSHADRLIFRDLSSLTGAARQAIAKQPHGSIHFGCLRCGAPHRATIEAGAFILEIDE